MVLVRVRVFYKLRGISGTHYILCFSKFEQCQCQIRKNVKMVRSNLTRNNDEQSMSVERLPKRKKARFDGAGMEE